MDVQFHLDPETFLFILLFIVFTNLILLCVLMWRMGRLELTIECKHSECRVWWTNVANVLGVIYSKQSDDVMILLESLRTRLGLSNYSKEEIQRGIDNKNER